MLCQTCPLRLHHNAYDYIFNFSLTSGQPGAVDGILKVLQKVSYGLCLPASQMIVYNICSRFIIVQISNTEKIEMVEEETHYSRDSRK